MVWNLQKELQAGVQVESCDFPCKFAGVNAVCVCAMIQLQDHTAVPYSMVQIVVRAMTGPETAISMSISTSTFACM